MELTGLQLLHHGVVIGEGELYFFDVAGIILIDENLDGLGLLLLFGSSRFGGFGILFLFRLNSLCDSDGPALVVRIQLKVSGNAVIRRKHIRPGDHGGMAVVARLRVQNGPAEQLGREDGLSRIGVICIAYKAAGAVVINPATRSDNLNGIGHAEQQADLKEVGEKVTVESDDEGKVIGNLHTLQIADLTAEEPVKTQDVFGTVDLAADLLNLR